MKSPAIPEKISGLFVKRNKLRDQGLYSQADTVRAEMLKLGYEIRDTDQGSQIIRIESRIGYDPPKPGKFAVFGSGETSTTGRKVHEKLIRDFPKPVTISLLETPTGYEDNPHHWYRKMADYLKNGLANYAPEIGLVKALDNSRTGGTNDPEILAPMLKSDYIHTGAGSPSYAVRHLRDSLALKYILDRCKDGGVFSLASAAAVAFSKYALPVYEIYFAGHDPSWLQGLDVFSGFGLNLTIIPHWNNHEGGADIDTRFSYMGQRRFIKLMHILPGPTTIMGIDEHTAVVFDPRCKTAEVSGKGGVHFFGQEIKDFPSHTKISFAQISAMCYFP